MKAIRSISILGAALAVPVVILAAQGVGPGGGAEVGAAGNNAAVADMVEQALLLSQESSDPVQTDTLALASRPSVAQIRLASAKKAAQPGVQGAAGVAEGKQRMAKRRSLVNRVFTGVAAQRQIEATAMALDAENDPNFQNFGAGVESFKITKLTVTGDSAQVTASSTAWASMAQRSPDGVWVPAVPRNDIIVTMTLKKNAAGKWLISVYDWTFATGSGP